jgi:thiol-disulfide isomerase/thioredoxin
MPIMLCSCLKKGDTATIRIDFSNEVPERFNIVVDPSHNLEYRQKDLKIDSLGFINAKIDIEKPSLLLMGGNSYMCFIVIQPGDDIKITFKGPFYTLPFNNDESSSAIIKGTNAEGQVALNQSLLEKFAYNKASYDEWNISMPDKLIPALKKTIEEDLSVYEKLYRKGEINKSFLETVTKFIGYQNALRLGKTIFNYSKGENNDLTKVEGVALLEEIFRLYPINSVDVLYSAKSLKSYIQLYLNFLELQDEKVFKVYKDSGTLDRYKLSIIKESVPQLVYERFAVDYLWGGTYNGGTYDHVNLYEEFVHEFPNCRYTWFLSELSQNIESIKRVNKQADMPFPEETKVIENYKDINSFDELIARFGGTMLFIDIWATWCGPCQYDHQHLGLLEEFAENKGLELVYVSIDKEGDRKKWENYIKYQRIVGYHMLANNQLVSNIKNELPEYKGIPRYIIVDEKGNIVEYDAKKPSDGNLLLEQLSSKLHL